MCCENKVHINIWWFTLLKIGIRMRINVNTIISLIAAVAKILKSTESTEKCIPYAL